LNVDKYEYGDLTAEAALLKKAFIAMDPVQSTFLKGILEQYYLKFV
jgi:hypothetical protein